MAQREKDGKPRTPSRPKRFYIPSDIRVLLNHGNMIASAMFKEFRRLSNRGRIGGSVQAPQSKAE